MSAATLLDRLDRVKQTGPSRWVARCPAHQDRSPSLSIFEPDDQRVLIHCFAGCSTEDVLAALGMEMRDLFAERLRGRGPVGGLSPPHISIPAADLLVILDHEITVAVLILSEIVECRKVNESQVQRLCRASARIGQARDIAAPAKVSHAA